MEVKPIGFELTVLVLPKYVFNAYNEISKILLNILFLDSCYWSPTLNSKHDEYSTLHPNVIFLIFSEFFCDWSLLN